MTAGSRRSISGAPPGLSEGVDAQVARMVQHASRWSPWAADLDVALLRYIRGLVSQGWDKLLAVRNSLPERVILRDPSIPMWIPSEKTRHGTYDLSLSPYPEKCSFFCEA